MLRDYLLEGGIKDRIFVDDVENKGEAYLVINLPKNIALESQGALFLSVKYLNRKISKGHGRPLLLSGHLDDIEAVIGEDARKKQYG